MTKKPRSNSLLKYVFNNEHISNILEAATGYTRLYVHVRRSIQCESKKNNSFNFCWYFNSSCKFL